MSAGAFQPRRFMSKSIRSPRHHCLLKVLIDARSKAGMTQFALAERVGRPQSYVAKYENGERRLDVIEFVELVEAIGDEPKKVFARFLSASKIA